MTRIDDRFSGYTNNILDLKDAGKDLVRRDVTRARILKVFESLPPDVSDLFLNGFRNLKIVVVPDPGLPFGMKTRAHVSSNGLIYTISICDEAQDWPEDHFIGSVFRELGHVVAELPPEEEWPLNRGARARFKEQAECRADALVWSWGLRHYDIIFLSATYPSHWVDKIVNDISLMLLSEFNKN